MSAAMNDSLWIKQVATLSQLVRIQGSRFAEALTKEDLSTICFIYRITEGERERRPLPIDVFQYLEERGEIDYSHPGELIDLMRLLQREKWARETQQLVESHRLQTSLQYPVVEESSVVLRPREIASQIRDKRKAIPLNLLDDETDSSYNDRICNHTCAKCNEQLRVRLQSPQLAEEIQKTISKFCATNLSCEIEEEEVEQDVGVKVQQTTSPFLRKGSTMSQKSTCSSGYGSMVIEQFENPLILLEETEASTTTSPTLSSISSSGLDQELLYPQLGISKPLSRQSSTEEYYTADEATSEENAINTNSVFKQDTTLCHDVSPRRHLWEDSAVETTIVAPPSNREVTISSMEVNTVELTKGLEASRSTTKIYKSYPFPSFGPQFQVQLSSSNSTDYALHLLTVPSLTSSPSHMTVRVCVYEGDKDVPVNTIPSSLIYTSTQEIDPTTTQTTPTTTSSMTSAGYTQYLATFPQVLNLTELRQIMSMTLIIKAFLEYNV